MPVSERHFSALCFAVILTYLAVLPIGLFMPLQTDEVTWLFIHSRFGLDDGVLTALTPQCGLDVFSRPAPWIWYLPLYAHHLTYGQVENPVWIRVGGMIQCAVWLGLWFAIAFKLFPALCKKWWAPLAGLLAFLGLDAIPLGLFINRPEQIQLIGIGTCVALALYADVLRQKHWLLKAATTLWMAFTVLHMHMSHQKAMAFLPLECVMYAVYLQRVWQRRVVTVAGLCLVTAAALQSYLFIAAQIRCPESPYMERFFKGQYVPLQMLWQSPLVFFESALKNAVVVSLSATYLQSFLQYTRNWIPFSLTPLELPLESLITIIDVGACVFYLSMFGAGLTACWRFRPRGFLRRDSAPPPAGEETLIWSGLVCIMLALCALFTLVSQTAFYSVFMAVPLILLAALLVMALKKQEIPGKWLFSSRTLLLIMACAVVNQALLVYRYEGFIDSPQAYETFDNHHKITTSAWGYGERRSAMLALAGQCHIGPDISSRRVVVDDMTYHTFRRTHQPLNLVYSTGALYRGSEKFSFEPSSYFALLRRFGSDGIIAECSNVPNPLLPYAKESAGFCCIPKATIDTPPAAGGH